MATSKSFLTFVKNNPKVKSWQKYDEYYDVLLKGFCDDEDYGRHTIIDTDPAEVIRRVRRTTPCECEECLSKSIQGGTEMTEQEKLEKLKKIRNEAMGIAEMAAHNYAKECDLGPEREKAFEVYDNLRMAGRVY